MKKPLIAIPFVLLVALFILPFSLALTFPLTVDNGHTLDIPAATNNEIISTQIMTNTSGMNITRIGIANGSNASNVFVFNNNFSIICVGTPEQPMNCALPYVGIYYVGSGSNGSFYLRYYDEDAVFPVVRDVMNWTMDTYMVCPAFSPGQVCEPTVNSTDFMENVRNITFNNGSAPVDFPPQMQSASVSVTSDNLTLIISANATDIDGGTVAYNYTVLNNAVVVTSVITGSFAQGITANIANYSIPVAGNYTASIFPIGNTSSILSNTIEVTFPGGSTPPSIISAFLAFNGDTNTLTLLGNATDNDTATVSFNYEVFRNGISFTTGNSGPFPQGMIVNFANVPITESGNYSFNVSAVGSATQITSNTLEATPSPQQSEDSRALGLVIIAMIIIVLITIVYAQFDGLAKEIAIILYVVMGIFLAIVLLSVML